MGDADMTICECGSARSYHKCPTNSGAGYRPRSRPAPAPSELEQTAFIQVGSDVPPSEWPAEFLARVLTGHADKHPYQPLRKALREAARRLSAAPAPSEPVRDAKVDRVMDTGLWRLVATFPTKAEAEQARAVLSAAPVAPKAKRERCKGDVCRLATPAGIMCADNECDIELGIRAAPVASPATEGAAFEERPGPFTRREVVVEVTEELIAAPPAPPSPETRDAGLSEAERAALVRLLDAYTATDLSDPDRPTLRRILARLSAAPVASPASEPECDCGGGLSGLHNVVTCARYRARGAAPPSPEPSETVLRAIDNLKAASWKAGHAHCSSKGKQTAGLVDATRAALAAHEVLLAALAAPPSPETRDAGTWVRRWRLNAWVARWRESMPPEALADLDALVLSARAPTPDNGAGQEGA